MKLTPEAPVPMNNLEAALCYIQSGLSIIPVGRNKRPVIAWESYQRTIADENTVRSWFEKKAYNLAVVTGAISGGLVVIDFDDVGFFDRWKSEIGELPDGLVVQKSGRGFHVFFRCPQPGHNQKLAFLADDGENTGRRVAVETRAEGGYILVEPSIHSSGKPYEVIQGDLTKIPKIEQQQAEYLLREAHLLDQSPTKTSAATSTVRQPYVSGKANANVIEAYNASSKIEDILSRNGYIIQQDKAIRPGGEHFSVTIRENRSFHFNSNDPLSNEHWRSAFDAFCLLEQDGNVKQAVKAAARQLGIAYQMREEESDHNKDGLPIIQTNSRYLRQVTADAMAALCQANQPPSFFVRSGELVRVKWDEQHHPKIEPITDIALRGRLDRVANFVVQRTYKKTTYEEPHIPPIEVVKDILAMEKWDFPPLIGIIECPTLRPDGTIISMPGYDPATHLFYCPAQNFFFPSFPENPTREEISKAVETLSEPLADFPFLDDASLANALGMMLTPLVRPVINGQVPLALIDAPQAGTGKSLLQSILGLLANGRDPAVITAPKSADEWRKKLTSALMSGASIIAIDNLTGVLDSGELASVLTTSVWADRALGKNEILELPQRATWLVNGNNIRLGGDLPRRCYWIRLDAKQSKPWQRSGFRHQDILGWVLENRGSLIAAALTLARGWFTAGCPESSSPQIGGFSGWVKTVNGILAYAGISGFLGNLETMYRNADDENPQWEAFLLELHEYFGKEIVTISTMMEAILKEKYLIDLIPDSLEDLFDDAGRVRVNFKKRLGKAFTQRQGMRFGDSQVFIEKCTDDSHLKVARWRFHCGVSGVCGM